MSRLKSMLYSTLIAPYISYNKENFNSDYFSKLKSCPDDKKAFYYRECFSPSNTLDVGCGIGNLVWGFLNSGVIAEGIDISKDAISQSPAEVKTHLRIGDIFNLDYPDNSFDLVNCSDILEHIPKENSCEAIQSLYRVTDQWLVLNICLWTEKTLGLTLLISIYTLKDGGQRRSIN